MAADLRARLEQAEGEAAQLRGQVTDLRVELAKAQAEVEAARAVAIADVATAQVEVEAQAKLITQLEALPTELAGHGGGGCSEPADGAWQGTG